MDSILKAVLIIFGFMLLAVIAGTVVGNKKEAQAAKKANRTSLDKSCSAKMSWVWFFIVYFFGGLGTFAIVGAFGLLSSDSSTPSDGFAYAALGAAGFIVGTTLVFLTNRLVAQQFAKAYGLKLEKTPPPMDVF